MSTESVLAEVAVERQRQIQKWGPQYLADTGDASDDVRLLGRTYAYLERLFKAECDQRRRVWQDGGPDRRNMAVATLEEVFEALAAVQSGRTADAREEMIQCAAMFVKWVEILDRREQGED